MDTPFEKDYHAATRTVLIWYTRSRTCFILFLYVVHARLVRALYAKLKIQFFWLFFLLDTI
jgi:hypothetical protein